MIRLILLLSILILAGCDKKQKYLHIYSWAEMFNPEVIEEFEKKCGCRVVIDSYDSNEMLYAKLRSGASGYDLILPSYYISQVMASQGMLEKIDRKKLPNLKYLDHSILTPIQSTLLEYSVPYAISYSGIGYRKDRIANFDPSWCVFGDRKYRGRMTILNDYREALGIALMCLGYNPNTTDEKKVNEAADLLIRWKPNIAKFENEQYKNGIATAEFLIAQGYSSDFLQVMRENPNVGFVLPKEGGLISYDQFAIPKKAPHKDLAYEFINFLYEPAVTAKNIEMASVLIPNREAYQYLPETLLKSEALFPSKEMKKKLIPLKDLGEDVLLYHRAWERVKES